MTFELSSPQRTQSFTEEKNVTLFSLWGMRHHRLLRVLCGAKQRIQ